MALTWIEQRLLEQIRVHGYLSRLGADGDLRFVISSRPGLEGPDTNLVPASAACALIEKGLVVYGGRHERGGVWYRCASLGGFRAAG